MGHVILKICPHLLTLVFFFLNLSSWLYLKGTQNDDSQKPCLFSKYVLLVKVYLCVYVHLSPPQWTLKTDKREMTLSGAHGLRPVTVPGLMENFTLWTLCSFSSRSPGQLGAWCPALCRWCRKWIRDKNPFDFLFCRKHSKRLFPGDLWHHERNRGKEVLATGPGWWYVQELAF